MATINVTDKASFRAAVNSSVSGDVIKCAGGVYDAMYWPANTTKSLTITNKDSNPPIFRGLDLAGTTTEGLFGPLSESGGTAANVLFDGLTFRPLQYTDVKYDNAKPVAQLAVPSDGIGGFGWRTDLRYYAPNGTGTDADMKALKMNAGNHHITVTNCLFEHFRSCLQTANNVHHVTFKNNTFRYNCEDMLFIGETDNLLIELNECYSFRGLGVDDAYNYYHWSDANTPPHADFMQFANTGSGTTNITVNRNYLKDTTGRVHGLFIPNPAAAANPSNDALKHQNLTITGNEYRLSHVTGILVGPTKNVTVRGNKIYKLSGSKNPYLQYASDNQGFHANFFTTPVDISNNVCNNFNPSAVNTSSDAIPSSWTLQGNQVINSDTVFPDNWLPLRKDDPNWKTGMTFAGVGGSGAGLPPTPGDPLQDADFNMLGTVEDPAYPNDATKRQTGVIEIPPSSAAFANPEIWWGASGDTPMPTVLIGTTTGGSKLYRCNSGSQVHLKTPGAAYTGIFVYYKDANGVLSQPSAVTCRFTVPQTNDRTVVYVKPKV